MKSRLITTPSTSLRASLSLFIVLLTACAPNATATSAAQPVVAQPTAIAPTTVPTLTALAQPAAGPTQELAPTPYPIATSRGPHLEATDPKTVTMASGNLQFVEFFEFWWTTCQQMAPMVHGLEAKYFGRIKFNYLEISNPQNAYFINYLGFRLRPSFYLLDGNGNILNQWIGQQTQDQFESIFAQYVK